MPSATYKDFCIDAADPHALAAFWGSMLGWDVNLHADGDADLRHEGHVEVWLNRVPEPVSVKNRLHLDVNAEGVSAVEAAGATVVDTSHPWTIMRDPDGQEFCVFVREEPIARRCYELAWDVTGALVQARELAEWWGEVLGSPVTHDAEWSSIGPVEGAPFESIVFAAVPEPKVTKNRIHIDVTCADVAPLVAAGATLVRAKGDGGIGWHVMTDPAGNEFCAFTPT